MGFSQLELGVPKEQISLIKTPILIDTIFQQY
jgi:hypothetical protein